MPKYSFNISKMGVQNAETVQYFMFLDEKETIHLNNYIGKLVRIEYSGQINCVLCGKRTLKSYGQGACYPCFINAPEVSPCIIKPALCEAHLGKGRDVEWEEKYHNKPHIVYLAKSSAIKVGVTRATAPIVRWIDQGASEAVVLAEFPYRQLAGILEVELSKFYTDKTNWQKMLKNQISQSSLVDEKKRAIDEFVPSQYSKYLSLDAPLHEFSYPVINYPKLVKSNRLDKTPIIEGTLQGVKGQYLYFENGQVFNVRNHSGYRVQFTI